MNHSFPSSVMSASDNKAPIVVHTPERSLGTNKNVHLIVIGAQKHHNNQGNSQVSTSKYGTRSKSRQLQLVAQSDSKQQDTGRSAASVHKNRVQKLQYRKPSVPMIIIKETGLAFPKECIPCRSDMYKESIVHKKSAAKQDRPGSNSLLKSDKKLKCNSTYTDNTTFGNGGTFTENTKPDGNGLLFVSKKVYRKPSILRHTRENGSQGSTLAKLDVYKGTQIDKNTDKDQVLSKTSPSKNISIIFETTKKNFLVEQGMDSKSTDSATEETADNTQVGIPHLKGEKKPANFVATIVKSVNGRIEEVVVEPDKETVESTRRFSKSISSHSKFDFLVDEIGKIVQANDKDFSLRHIEHTGNNKTDIAYEKHVQIHNIRQYSTVAKDNNGNENCPRNSIIQNDLSNNKTNESVHANIAYNIREEGHPEIISSLKTDGEVLEDVYGNKGRCSIAYINETEKSSGINALKESVAFSDSSCQTDFSIKENESKEVNCKNVNNKFELQMRRQLILNKLNVENENKSNRELNSTQSPNDKLNEFEYFAVKHESKSDSCFEEMDVDKFRHTAAVSKQYRCKLCQLNFSYGIDLNRHVSAYHNNSTGFYNCTICDKTFSEQRYLRIHMKRHTGEAGKKHTCPTCGWKFFELNKMKLHMEKHKEPHLKTLPYKCKYCQHQFYNYASLRDHLNIHKGIRPHKCKLCNADFAHEIGLRRHHVVHEMVGQYACKHCEKTFKFKNKLTEHLVTHTKQSKHFCLICGNVFGAASSLKRHQMRGRCHVELFVQNDGKEEKKVWQANQNLQLQVPEVQPVEVMNTTNLMFVCACCRMVFSAVEDLAKHICKGPSEDVSEVFK